MIYCTLFSGNRLYVLLFLLVVLKLSYRMQRMVIRIVWTLFSPIRPKVLLFFASSFDVGLKNATYGHT